MGTRTSCSGRIGLALLLVGIGGLGAWVGLWRLGWRRHGAAALDLSFLHLDWLRDVHAASFRAHLANLLTLGVGVLLLGLGCVLAARVAREP